MPSLKTVAVAVTLATSVAASSIPLEVRSDLDLTSDDLDTLFSRDVDVDSADLELIARDLDIDAEDLETLIARASASAIGGEVKEVAKGAKWFSEHKDGIKNGFKVAGKAFGAGGDLWGIYTAAKSLTAPPPAQQTPAPPAPGQQAAPSKRDLEDQILARALDLDAEDLDTLIARATEGAPARSGGAGKAFKGVAGGIGAISGLLGAYQTIQQLRHPQQQTPPAAGQQAPPSRRDLFARDLDLDAEDLDILIARATEGAPARSGGAGKAFSGVAGGIGAISGLLSAYQTIQQLRHPQQQTPPAAGQQAPPSRRDLFARDLDFDAEDLDVLFAREPRRSSWAHSREHKSTVHGAPHHPFGRPGEIPRVNQGLVNNGVSTLLNSPSATTGELNARQLPLGDQESLNSLINNFKISDLVKKGWKHEVGHFNPYVQGKGVSAMARRGLFDDEEDPEVWY